MATSFGQNLCLESNCFVLKYYRLRNAQRNKEDLIFFKPKNSRNRKNNKNKKSERYKLPIEEEKESLYKLVYNDN